MLTTALASWFLLVAGVQCTPSEPNVLDKLPTVDMTLHERKFRLWVADDFQEQARGLMFIKAEQMTPLPDGTERGMLFVFDHSVRDSFWMKNTIIPLDIAYLSSDGEVISIYTMTPLDDRFNQYPPAAPYRYAIEVNAGVFQRVGLKPGHRVTVPRPAGQQKR